MASETAFLFPGQGSQSVGMLAELYEQQAPVRETFEQASSALGYDLWHICANGPEEKLNQTELTQPAMLAADIATWRAWLALGGIKPTHLAGHSLGEYAALVAADALDFATAISLVALRGRLMQEATPAGTGAMAAILGLEDQQVEEVCQQASGDELVSCANFNSPGQVVIAGHTAAVERACEVAREAGARRAIVLPVSVPSHCGLMKSAADELAAELARIEIQTPTIPVVQNVDAQARTNPADISEALVAQLWQPVQWTRTVQLFASMGISELAECGPGRVLAGLCRRISRDLKCAALIDTDSISSTRSDWSQ